MSNNMKTITQKKKKSAKSKNSKDKKNKVFTAFKLIIIIGLVGGLLAGVGLYLYITGIISELPPIDPSTITDNLAENSIIVDEEGRVLSVLQIDETRTVVEFQDISTDLINAFVGVEDKTFWEHSGINYVRLVGAFWDAFTTGDSIQGTSTITQQLARNIYLEETRSERSVDRKVKEMYYAMQLEYYLEKEQIIENYLNKIYLGAGAHGIQAASQIYFSKDASELNKVEGAILAGIPSSPEYYAPMINKEKINVTEDDVILNDTDPTYTVVYNPNCEDRYQTVIYMMHLNEYITDEEYAEMQEIYIPSYLNPGQTAENEITTYFTDMVFNDVVEDLVESYEITEAEAQNMVYTKGLTIYSTIDFDMQKTLESAYALDSFTGYYGSNTATAVKSFQRANGLSVDGTAGQGTLGKMAELGYIDMEDFPESFYAQGMEKDEIIILNQALFDNDYLISVANVPLVTAKFDSSGNIISNETYEVLLYEKSDLINDSEQLIIPSPNFEYNSNGDLVLYKDKFFDFYPQYDGDELKNIQVVLNAVYDIPNSSGYANGTYDISGLYTYEARDLYVFDPEVKSLDENGNLIIDKSFISDNPEFFTEGINGELIVEKENYYISDQGIIQPQSSMVIIDYHTGELKAIVGGRNITGQKIYNRATSTRQPGSSIKPLAVYTPAIDSRRYTAATVLDDVPVYLNGSTSKTPWPNNWYSDYEFAYKGLQTVRQALELSINVIATLIVDDLGVQNSIDYLKKFGISTIVEEGNVNDLNLSAVALGGMTQGIEPYELTAAYGALANKGVHTETKTYSQVLDSDGNVILVNSQEKTLVVDEQVAYIVQDMMRSGVTSGVATDAQLYPGNTTIPVAGKTGTTSDRIDVWFAGYTPYYVAGIWFGNDVNIPLDQSSAVSAAFWSDVMKSIHVDLEPKDFDVPEGLVTATIDTKSGLLPSELSSEDPRGTVRSEIFLPNTVPTEEDNVHVEGSICTESLLAATEYCPETTVATGVYTQRVTPYVPEDNLDAYGQPIYPLDWEFELPLESCDIHNTVLLDPNYSIDYSNMDSLSPYVTIANGNKVVLKPFNVELTDGSYVLVLKGSTIEPDNTIIFPDESEIPAYKVEYMPDFEIDDYNDYYEYNPSIYTPVSDEKKKEDENTTNPESTDTID